MMKCSDIGPGWNYCVTPSVSHPSRKNISLSSSLSSINVAYKVSSTTCTKERKAYAATNQIPEQTTKCLCIN